MKHQPHDPLHTWEMVPDTNAIKLSFPARFTVDKLRYDSVHGKMGGLFGESGPPRK